MREISAVELMLAVKELQNLVSSSFKGMRQLGEGSFLIEFSRERKNVALYIKLNRLVCETRFVEEKTEQSDFASVVKKKLEGNTLTSIEQHDSDRIIVMSFEGATKRELIIEMLGKGNVVLVNEKKVVELSYRGHAYKERQMLTGSPYVFPKSDTVDYDQIDEQKAKQIVESLKIEKEKLIVALAKQVNLGPIYLEDIIRRAGLNPKEGTATQLEKGSKQLELQILDFFRRIKEPKPRIYVKDGKYVDFSAVPLLKYEELEKNALKFKTMGELFDSVSIEERSSEVDEEKTREFEELSKSAEKLKTQIKELQEKSKAYAEIANKVFERMHEVNSAIEQVKKSTNARECVGMKFGTVSIKGIDAKNKIAKVEIE